METSKTPNFDALLDPILDGLVPHTRICAQSAASKYCEGEFEIGDKDIEFLRLLRVPAPTLCPTCRRQKRFAFLNRFYFYKRPNNTPGKEGVMISNTPPNSPLVVYDLESYRSDLWDPFSYAETFSETGSFFDQFWQLRLRVPQPGILRHPSNVNYEYSLNGKNSKNVYCSSGIFDSEDIWYTLFSTKSRQVMDSHKAYKLENCYGAIFCNRLSNCTFIYFSQDCIDSWFLYDCRNCQNCFGSVNLRNKQYCFENVQLTKEEYETKIKALELDKRSSIEKASKRFWEFAKSQPVLASRSTQAIDCDGVVVMNCKDCTKCVSIERSEHERYSDSTINHRDSMDVYASGASELMYECAGSGGQCANVKFAVISKSCVGCEYVINCNNCQNCFGCIGLETKSYCIFNKQYEPEEYFKELDRVKSAMLSQGEYGEFLPYRFSAFAYNGSDVDVVYPLADEGIGKLGALFQEYIDIDMTGLTTISKDAIPDSIHDVTDEILSKAIICEQTGKPFRIIASELEFYRRHTLPVPTIHPYERMKHMVSHIGNHVAKEGTCESCGKELKTVYSKDEGWRLYCEECFQRECL